MAVLVEEKGERWEGEVLGALIRAERSVEEAEAERAQRTVEE